MTLSEDVRKAVHLRPMVDSDRNFVISSWLRSYRDNSADVEESRIPGAVYWPMHEEAVKRLLECCDVMVAHTPEAPEVILGWACFERRDGVLHYLYVKQAYRLFAVEDYLADRLPKCRWHTHRTPRLLILAQRLGLVFNPYLAGVTP